MQHHINPRPKKRVSWIGLQLATLAYAAWVNGEIASFVHVKTLEGTLDWSANLPDQEIADYRARIAALHESNARNFRALERAWLMFLQDSNVRAISSRSDSVLWSYVNRERYQELSAKAWELGQDVAENALNARLTEFREWYQQAL